MAGLYPDSVSYLYVRGYSTLVGALDEVRARYVRQNRPIAAEMIVRTYSQLKKELQEMALVVAAEGTETLRRIEKETRVRPSTQGGGGPRLGDHLFCRVLAPDIVPGSVGVGDLDSLNQLGDWWLADELGSRAHVGRVLYGAFTEAGGSGRTPPDMDQFRSHPLFDPGYTKGDPTTGSGRIVHPLPARHYLTKAEPIIRANWDRKFEAIKRVLDLNLDRAYRTYR